MYPNENDLEGVPDKKLKRAMVIMLTQLEEGKNKLSDNKNEEWDKFNRNARYENRIHCRNRITEEIKTEMMVDMKNSESRVHPQWKASSGLKAKQGIGSLTKSQ